MLAEDDEIFEVFLKLIPNSPFNVTIGEPSIATGIIFDDDMPSKIFYKLLSTSILAYEKIRTRANTTKLCDCVVMQASIIYYSCKFSN